VLSIGVPVCVTECWLEANPPRVTMRAGREEMLCRPDPTLGWTLQTELSRRVIEVDQLSHRVVLDYEVHSTALGTRGRDPVGLNTQETIAVVGDSFTFGVGVDDSDTFCAKLQAMRPAGREVVNYGVAGYGLGQMLLRLVNEAMALKPRVVVVAIIEDDIERTACVWSVNGYPRPQMRVDCGRLMVASERLPGPVEFGRPLPERGWILGHKACEVVDELRARISGDPSRSWRLGEAVLKEALQAIRAGGARPILALLSGHGGAYTPVMAALRKLNGFEIVDASAMLNDDPSAFLPIDGHPSRRGHEIIASEIERRLSMERRP
jgi:hypothetical protein